MNLATNINNNVNANSGVRQVTKNILAAVLLAAGCASAMANVSPQVKILSVESNGAAPATIKLDAAASDSDGSIAKVEFFSDTTLLGTATQAPFTFTWTGAATGSYSISAKATDNLGASSVTIATGVVVGSSSAQPYYIHSDQIDTAKLITNDAGQAVWKSDTEPFGANMVDENPHGLGLFAYNNRFPGQYFDRETGLHYNYYRDYDPQIGRYIQSDPIGLDGGINTYGYVGANPITQIDPRGQSATLVAAGTLGGGGSTGGLAGAIASNPAGWVAASGLAGALVGKTFYDTFDINIQNGIDWVVGEPMATAEGNHVDTEIKADYDEHASAQKLCGKKPDDPCDWLRKNKGKYSDARVKKTGKAWGCTGSRHSKGGKNR